MSHGLRRPRGAQFIGRVNLLPARVVRTGAGSAVVALWGREVTVAADEGAAAGQTVSLVLRPESVGLLPQRAAAPAHEVVVEGVVRGRTFLGEKVEYAVGLLRGQVLQSDNVAM